MLSLAALCLAANARAQDTGRITGTVTSADDGRPIAGATVQIVGTVRAAVSDAAGHYSIAMVPAGKQTVRVRSLGFASSSRQATIPRAATDADAITLNFQLSAAPVQLEGMVVTAYYGEEEQRDLTGSIATVRMEQLRDVPMPNPVQMLQARAPGVDVVGAGYRPGAPMNVRIRGVRSISANNEPLYVVDGMAVAGNIEDLNPSSITSIEVLKDAAATAPYGAAGANGVILITTNRGASGVAGGSAISYDVQYGVQSAVHLVDLMNGPQLLQERIDAARLAGRGTALGSILNAPELPTAYCILNVKTNPSTGQYDTTAAGTSTWQAVHPGCSMGTDWQRMVLRTGSQRQHRLTYSYNHDNARIALAGSAFDQTGITLGQGYSLYSGTVSLENTYGRLRIGATATGSRSVADIGANNELWGEANANSPLGQPYLDSLGRPSSTLCRGCTLQMNPSADPLRTNPLREAQAYVHQHTRSRLLGSLFAELQLGLGFTDRVDFGADVWQQACGQFQGANVVLNGAALGNARAQEIDSGSTGYGFDNVLSWDLNTGAHKVEGTFVYGMMKGRTTSSTAAAWNLPYDSQLWYNLGSGAAPQPPQSTLSASTGQSFMGRVNYTLRNRYSASVTGRADGSSVLAPGHKWAFFPSVGLAWQLGDEPFMRPFTFVSGLKLRASLGTTGNSSVLPYQTEGTLSRTVYNFGSSTANGYVPGAIPNPNLEWEKTQQLDIGIDFGVLRNRISGTFDVYREKTSDLLLPRALPPSSGFTQTLQNIGMTGNVGWELGISTVNLTGTGGGPRWTTDFSFTHNQNYIISLAGGVGDDVADRWFVGQPINIGQQGDAGYDALHQVFYDYKFVGIWQLADSLLARQYGQRPGDIRVADLNGDGKIDGFDRMIQGNTYPRLIASVYNHITWGAFDLSFLLQGRIGYTFSDGFRVNTSLFDRYNDLNVQYWTPERCDGGPDPAKLDPPAGVTAAQQAASAPGCNVWWVPSAGRQNPLYDDPSGLQAPGYRVGTHWRVRNITLGFTLPASLVRKVRGVHSMRLYLEAQDPWVFSSYYGYDPENGSSRGPPSYRTVLMGLTLGF